MFSYYGSKSKLAKFYPAPIYDRIIEPFAGSARYSLLHFEKDITLFDTNPVIVRLWQYLIDATDKDILSLPDIESKKNLDEIKDLAPVERDLIGFHLCRGKARPRKVGHGQNSWNRDKVRIASNVWKVKHWKVGSLAFGPLMLFMPASTWFIDMPYQKTQVRTNGDRYPYGGDLDYHETASVIRQLNGQVIVCEGDGADWLPFEPLKTVRTNTNNREAKSFTEMVYLRV